MKGLLVKDIELMKQQKQSLIIIIAMGIILNLTGSGGVSFATGYFTIITAIFTITTISYDEFDNGFVFLMTLPISRKRYVEEKYFLGAVLVATAWVIATILSLICKFALGRGESVNEIITGSVVIVPIAFLMLAVFIPLAIYFGVEKGRYIAIVLWVIIFAAICTLTKTVGISEEALDAWLNSVHMGNVFVVAAVVTIAIYLFSGMVSVRFMEKKEF